MSDLEPDRLKELRALAREASLRAYAPYSGFRVGAAVVSTQGQIYASGNIENASYGLCSCAERNAIYQMVFAGQTQLGLVLIYTPTDTPTAPCGACRQVIYEFGPEARVVCTCDGPQVLDYPIDQLLPHAFGPQNLAVNRKFLDS